MGSAGVGLKVRRHKEKIAIITMNTPVFVVCVCVCVYTMVEETWCECSKGSLTPALTIILLQKASTFCRSHSFLQISSSPAYLCSSNHLKAVSNFHHYFHLSSFSLQVFHTYCPQTLPLSQVLCLVCASSFLKPEIDRPITATLETKVRACRLHSHDWAC